ncbi:tRNA1(Val) (adenine(37)-N6)-methyltransferase [Hippea sp. KM1]|uniref:tRNA1(Val) (adenine(37)-N6)-methyltransferase n=1 Tax=Hippea sp. KM1 TaxID=944481 RepID=UPI00046D6FDF|nr:methyltransferase [Hippea sp. KM1]
MELTLNRFKGFDIYQPKYGYRFSAEPFVLTNGLEFKTPKKVVDFGSGCGIIAIITALKNPDSFIYAIEKNPEYIKIIEKNLRINNISNVVVLEDAKSIPPNTIDYFISNPPYFKKGKFRPSVKYPNEKFETGGSNMFVAEARRLLKNKGTLRFTFHPSALVELVYTLNSNNFGLKAIQPVYGKLSKDSPFILIEAKLASKDYIEFKPPIVLKELEPSI